MKPTHAQVLVRTPVGTLQISSLVGRQIVCRILTAMTYSMAMLPLWRVSCTPARAGAVAHAGGHAADQLCRWWGARSCAASWRR